MFHRRLWKSINKRSSMEQTHIAQLAIVKNFNVVFSLEW